MINDTGAKPITRQANIAKLPRALAPLIERPQWVVWKWTQQGDGWQKPPFMATQPQRHASTKDPSTWADYATALDAVEMGEADGISYILTEDDPFAAIDLDHCRHVDTHSIDPWAQLFLEFGRHTYSEVTPSGAGCRIWGLANGAALHRKFTLENDGKEIAVELFRRTRKALTITGYRLDTIRELTGIDKVLDWGVIWGERRKAAVMDAAALSGGNGFGRGGCKYSIDQIELIVRNGAPAGVNRSDVFHSIVGHYLGCGWSPEQIHQHLAQFPEGVGGRYLHEERLAGEIARSAGKYMARELPLLETNGGWINGWETKAPQPDPQPAPQPEIDDDLDDDDLGEDDLGEDELEDEPAPDPKLPQLYTHGDPDPRPLKNWLVKHLIPACGHGLLSGQWGAGKTFVVFDIFAALATQQPFIGHAIKRRCGMLLIAAEGADDVRLRLEAVVREKCGGMARTPVCWYETTPMLLHDGAVETLITMAQQADESLQQEFGLPLGLIVVDTIAACAGYARTGDENDPAVGQAVMNALRALAQAANCFVLGVDHFGKSLEAGTRGASSKEASVDLVLACLGHKELSGSVINTRLAVRKNRGGKQGQEFPFVLRTVEVPERDEDGEPITTMVVDWNAKPSETTPPNDPWQQSRRQDQRTAALRLKRVLMSVLAETGVDQSLSPDGPMVRMVDQEIVRAEFYAHTPADGTPERKGNLRRQKFSRALGWAEENGLIGVKEVDDVVYLSLTRPNMADETEEEGG